MTWFKVLQFQVFALKYQQKNDFFCCWGKWITVFYNFLTDLDKNTIWWSLFFILSHNIADLFVYIDLIKAYFRRILPFFEKTTLGTGKKKKQTFKIALKS